MCECRGLQPLLSRTLRGKHTHPQSLCPPTGWRGREHGPRVEALSGSTALSALNCLLLDMQQERGTNLYSVKIMLCWGVYFSRSVHSLYRSILTHTSTSQGFKSSSDPAWFDSCYNPSPQNAISIKYLTSQTFLGLFQDCVFLLVMYWFHTLNVYLTLYM